MFRAELNRAGPRSDGTKGGRPRPAFDDVLTFKILLLQAMHGLSPARRPCAAPQSDQPNGEVSGDVQACRRLIGLRHAARSRFCCAAW